MASFSSVNVNDLFSLRGKVALITGATGHLGGAMAHALAEAGAGVVVSSRELSKALAFAKTLPVVDEAVHHAIAMDHTDEASVHAGFESAVAKAGQVDVLVNNGIQPSGIDWRSITGEQFARHMANAGGCFLLARALRDHVVKRNAAGSIVMIGSMYGMVGSYPEVYENLPASPVAYHMLKGGIIQLTRYLAVYWAKDGVRVNCLSPGPFPGAKAPAELVEKLCEKSPMGRMGRADELKGVVVFLSSNASSYMTGQNLVIDGGWTAW